MRYTTPTSTSLSASVVGSIVQSAPDFPHSGGDLCEPDTTAPDVVTSASGVGTLTPAPDVTADRSGDGGTGTDSERIATSSGVDGAGEGQLLGDGGSASTADTRLPFSYRTLISMAIAQSPLRKVTRSEIYEYIVGRFPYLKRKGKIVQHSLSCTLSSSKCFVKVPREADGDKGIYWTLDPRYDNTSENANFRCLQQMEWPFRQGLAAAVPAHRVLQAADATTVSGSGDMPLPAYPPYTSAGQAAPNSSRPGEGHCENDTPVSDTTSAGDAAVLTSDSGGTADRGETAAGRAADGIGEDQCRSVAGSASTAKKKPLFSYTELGAMAIAQSPHRRAKLYEIFAYVTRRFPYFRRNRKIWQKALSTTLSRNKCFINVRQEAGKLKGSYWMFDPQYEDMLKNDKFSLWRRKQPFRSGPTAAAVPAREVRTRRGRHRHRGLHPQWQQHVTGLSEQPQLPETGGSGGGGGSLLLPAYPPRTSTTTQMSADLVASEVGSGDPAETDSTPTSADRRGDGTGTAGGGTALDGGVIGAGEGQCSGSASSARTARKRPQFSYTELSAMAIAQSPHRRAKLSEMYAYVMSRFPYYRRKKFWQKAFSNNLSRSKCFVNVPLEGDKQKGNYWMLDPKYEAMLEKGNFRHRHEERPFLGSPAVSVPLRRQRHGTGLSEHPQVPESGGCGVGDAAVPLPSYQHYSRPAQIRDGSDSASFEESNLQNVTRDELLMAQEMSTHFISCSDPTRDSASFEESSLQDVTHNELVTAQEMPTHFISCSAPTRGIITREDNSFCSTDNIDGRSDDPHPICDLQNVKVEVVEDPLTVQWFNGCFKEDPDAYLGVNATESEEEARGRHAPDVTR
ncbi:uncharacterized protein LOC124720202 [Schistocerca piceifrons]|uniref:uncharacterized protein LOC124720202 n=1 Tax=Schistocerca piceifrons TaxID=274613 RepID=UPI001F5F0107|nr:uncharacterized protein LOC124720202 [Schistocerca piceifrons]